jgi:hypothetical protein
MKPGFIILSQRANPTVLKESPPVPLKKFKYQQQGFKRINPFQERGAMIICAYCSETSA